ncbi:MAG: fumarylacetoacetase [Acidobacteriaceae bacterium]|nr:fumarylacetoacetase [Acidobacteriaceae bacterium]
MIDETHDPGLRSWVESANRAGCEFPIQNLPLGVFRLKGEKQARCGVAIGDFILDASGWLSSETLNGYMALPASDRRQLRLEWSRILRAGSPERELLPQTGAEMLLPARIGDYSDFYASIHHATNVGRMFRPENPLFPNYKHVPIAYHGRSSSVFASGTAIKRPSGQRGQGDFGPTRELDYEVEIGAFVGPGNAPGEPIPISEARQHIVGVCLVNDWSARDIQRWEYQPLGPFLSKSFATSISPWVITTEALEPFREEAATHETDPLPYLQESQAGAFNIMVEAWLLGRGMRQPVRLSRSSFREMYWTLPQMLTHHTSNGCPARPGDLIASGTISGPEKENRGCLLELTEKGKEPVRLPDGEERVFLEDGDQIVLRGHCKRDAFVSIGLGCCAGTIVAAG